MDPLQELSISLGKVVVENSYAIVTSKIKKIKSNSDKDKQIREYDALLDDLMDDKSELQRIAMAYKQELERVIISDNDIESLHKTVEKILDIFKNHTDSDEVESFNSIIELLDSDTLRTLQLLGYNYKDAIGKPLTEVTASFIHSHLEKKEPNNL